MQYEETYEHHMRQCHTIITVYHYYLALTKVLVINLFYREGTTNYILSKTQQETSIRQVSSIYCKH